MSTELPAEVPTFEEAVELRAEAITPKTRRIIIYALGIIALAGILAEVIIVLFGETSSEALLTVVATAVGGIAGLAVPGGRD